MAETDNSNFSLQATLHTVTKDVILNADHILEQIQMAQGSPFHTRPRAIQSKLPLKKWVIPHSPPDSNSTAVLPLAQAHGTVTPTIPLPVLCTSIFTCPAGMYKLLLPYFHIVMNQN